MVYITHKREDTFYRLVDLLTLPAHIADRIGGAEVTDVVALHLEMPTYWAADPRVPQYVIRTGKPHFVISYIVPDAAPAAVSKCNMLLLADSN